MFSVVYYSFIPKLLYETEILQILVKYVWRERCAPAPHSEHYGGQFTSYFINIQLQDEKYAGSFSPRFSTWLWSNNYNRFVNDLNFFTYQSIFQFSDILYNWYCFFIYMSTILVVFIMEKTIYVWKTIYFQ